MSIRLLLPLILCLFSVMSMTSAAIKLKVEGAQQLYVLSQPNTLSTFLDHNLKVSLKSSEKRPWSLYTDLYLNAFHGLSSLSNSEHDNWIPNSLIARLDRFFFKIKAPQQRLTFGIQHLAWHSPSFFTVSDTFNPPNFFNPTGKTQGLPAFQWLWFTDELSYVNLGYSWDLDSADPRNGKLAAQYNTNLLNSDIHAGLIYNGKLSAFHPTLALKGDLPVLFSYYVDAISLIPRQTDQGSTQHDMVFGLLTHLTARTMISAEYYSHQIQTVLKPVPFDMVGTSSLSTGRYTTISLSQQWFEDWNTQLSQLIALEDGSSLTSISLQFDIASGMTISLATQLFHGAPQTTFHPETIGLSSFWTTQCRYLF